MVETRLLDHLPSLASMNALAPAFFSEMQAAAEGSQYYLVIIWTLTTSVGSSLRILSRRRQMPFDGVGQYDFDRPHELS